MSVQHNTEIFTSFSHHSLDQNKTDLPHKFCYSVLFQVFPEILPQMQPELPKECREPTRHAAISGRKHIRSAHTSKLKWQNCNFKYVC